MHVEHIIWDWNGTLFADGRALIESTIDAFEAAGLGAIAHEDYQRLHCQPISSFYDRLAGRQLSAVEQELLEKNFYASYQKRREDIALAHDAVEALTTWQGAGRSQSLLSMHPHDRLMSLVQKFGLAEFFLRIDGLVGDESAYKAPHLRRHLDYLDVSKDNILLIGDSVDDAKAASQCGINCILYHAGANALHAEDHFTDLGVPVVAGLRNAVAAVLDADVGVV
ncbi:HAD family hydrolase [Nocardia transvalensis]|uniref:HAD family hydrolase n=1 Tax=Nocardia transvalensis TaxID=37333 RepID=UPI001896182F|nr:HAD hydrolase-like protein [Nocardia transvalensis]MBF6331125.1 HAD family hydrolase [Nocardia transvalensis]